MDDVMTERDWITKFEMESPTSEAEPVGMLDHACRCAVRDLVRLYGFEEARMMIAGYLNDEADRSPRNV